MVKAPVRRCAKCEIEGITTKRKVVTPPNARIPLCATHRRGNKSEQRAARKSAHVQRTYSITEEQYQDILQFQDGCCYICKRRPGRKRLSVDHDHKCCSGSTSCGQCVRGLLCSTCNKYLGYLRDDPEKMTSGAVYLNSPPAHFVIPRA